MRKLQNGKSEPQPGRRPAPLYPAIIAIFASTAVLAHLTWKYYGLAAAALLVIFVLFALFRVLRAGQQQPSRDRFRA